MFPHVGAGFWALVALAGVLGGVMRSPFTGVVFALELTQQFDAVLPLIIGATTAFAVSVLLLKRSVLTEKIARRGLHLTREYSTDPLETTFAGEVMDTDVICLSPGSRPVNPAAGQRLYPVVDDTGRLTGIVTGGALSAEAANPAPAVVVDDLLVTDPIVVHLDDTLRHVANVFAENAITRAPVTDRQEPDRLRGVISLADLLQARLHDLTEEHHRARQLVLPRRRTVEPALPTTRV
jgi:CBS domain-containing protein